MFDRDVLDRKSTSAHICACKFNVCCRDTVADNPAFCELRDESSRTKIFGQTDAASLETPCLPPHLIPIGERELLAMKLSDDYSASMHVQYTRARVTGDDVSRVTIVHTIILLCYLFSIIVSYSCG